MSKLFKLREWLTVADAARYLAIAFDEEVIEADVLRLALDGHLKLSVNFVNHAWAKCGQVVPWEGTEWLLVPPLRLAKTPAENHPQVKASARTLTCPTKLQALLDKIPVDERAALLPIMKSIVIDDECYLNLSDEVTTIEGVWDLLMIGNERLDIEHEYQNQTGGPAVTLQGLDGAFVENLDGQIYQLQESLNDNEYQPGSIAELEHLKTKIVNENIKKSEAERLLNQHKEARKEYLEKREWQHKSDDYYPAGGLPKDSVLVVRTAALREFERKATETPEQGAEKPLSTTERNSLLTIIGIMAKDGYGNDMSKPYEFAKEIQIYAEKLGIKISDDTIANKLKDAKKVLNEKIE
jgi:hypothetical protein